MVWSAWCAAAATAGLRLVSAAPFRDGPESAAILHEAAEFAVLWKRFSHDFPVPAAAASADLEMTDGIVPDAFATNVRRAVAMNKDAGADCTSLLEGQGCVFGLTKFSAVSRAEFASHLGYKRRDGANPLESNDAIAAAGIDGSWQAPAKMDWRTEGAVTPVKDQGGCGSCWAFSVTSEVESAHYMRTKNLVELSTQELISCDGGDGGCNGGDPISAYRFLKAAGGLDVASDYPDRSHTTGESGTCTWDHKVSVSVSGYNYAVKPCDAGNCKHQDEDGLKRALAAQGPVSICVAADTWQSYTGGVLKSHCPSSAELMDHCVQMVGYDTTGSVPYWIIRNSWGEGWGIDGYIHVMMGHNFCGLANEATFAVTDNSEVPVFDQLLVV